MSRGIDLRVSRSLELLGALKQTVSDYAKKEEQLVRDLSNRRYAANRGYRDALDASGKPIELPTRVNQPRVGEQPLAHEDEISVVRLLDKNSGLNRRDH